MEKKFSDSEYMNHLNEMSEDELNYRYNYNKRKLKGNNLFWGTATIGSMFMCPVFAIVPFGIGALNTSNIEDNVTKIEQISEERGMSLKRTK